MIDVDIAGMISSGETLVNFINNASSSVTTVLSQPGSFKRNINVRRFLQKQLRQTVQQQVGDTPSATPSIKAVKHDTEKLQDIIKETYEKKEKSYKQKTIRKKRRFNPILTANPPTSPNMSPRIIPSPTFTEYSDRQDMDYETLCFSSRCRSNYQTDNFLDRTPSPTTKYPTTLFYPVMYPPLLPSLLHSCQSEYTLSSTSSSSCYSDSRENFSIGDFLSGEDLLHNLELGDLFIPDDEYRYINELICRYYVENEKQLIYLEELERSFYDQKNDFVSHSIVYGAY